MDAWTAYALIAVAFGAGYVVGRARQPASTPAAPPPMPDPKVLEAVRPILQAEGKIAAIRAYREATGVGLREGKLAVEMLEDESGA